jgi:hypothetical protein
VVRCLFLVVRMGPLLATFAALAGEPGVVRCLFLCPIESMLTHRVICK